MPLFYQDSILQTAFTEITVNTSTSATTYSGSLLSLSVTTGANSVILYLSVSCGNSAATQWTEFQLLQDGVAKRGIAVFSTSSGNGNSGELIYKTSPLTAGAHTFTVQWHIGTFAGGTGTVNPATLVVDHATLYLEEVTV